MNLTYKYSALFSSQSCDSSSALGFSVRCVVRPRKRHFSWMASPVSATCFVRYAVGNMQFDFCPKMSNFAGLFGW